MLVRGLKFLFSVVLCKVVSSTHRPVGGTYTELRSIFRDDVGGE